MKAFNHVWAWLYRTRSPSVMLAQSVKQRRIKEPPGTLQPPGTCRVQPTDEKLSPAGGERGLDVFAKVFG